MTSLWKVYFSPSFLPAHPSPQSRTLVGLFELTQLPSRDFNLASCVVSETTDMIVKSQRRRFELLTRPDMEHSSELWRVSSRAQEPLRAIPWSGPTTKSSLTSINMQIEKKITNILSIFKDKPSASVISRSKKKSGWFSIFLRFDLHGDLV